MKRLVADKNVIRTAVVLLAIFCWSALETLAQETLDDLAPRKFDEYVLEGEQRWLRLDRFVAQLRREPKRLGYVIVYADRRINGPGVYYDGEDWKRWVYYNLKARGLSEDAVRNVMHDNVRPRFAGIFGEPGVNVLDVNLALDRMSAPAH